MFSVTSGRKIIKIINMMSLQKGLTILPTVISIQDFSQLTGFIKVGSVARVGFEETVSRDFLSPKFLFDICATNPSGLLIDMLKYFQIWLRFLRRYPHQKLKYCSLRCHWHRGVKISWNCPFKVKRVHQVWKSLPIGGFSASITNVEQLCVYYIRNWYSVVLSQYLILKL